MEIIRELEQGTPEWFAIRLGVITGSKFKDVMAKGAGKTRKSYMYQLAAEIITGQAEEGFTNSAMEWGTENEPAARAMYELHNKVDVDEVCFIKRDDFVGVSPDGLVGESGLTEFKCPKTTTQIETFLSGKMPTTHKAQVQGQIWVAEREWCDFVSYDPRVDGDASYCCYRQERDDEYIKVLEEECYKFSDELKAIVKTLRG
jgi:putative phage-type endonuclease